MRILPSKDLLFALLLLGFAAVVFYGTSSLDSGSARSMGPGYFPRLLALLTMAVACVLVVRGLFRSSDIAERFDPRPVAAILGSALLFALLLRPMGLIVAIVAAVMAASFGTRDFSWGKAFATAVVLAIGCSLVFVVLLGQQIPLAGTLY